MNNRIFFIREEHDITQEQLGKEVGTTRVSISKWETLKEIPPIRKANIIANKFNISLDYIFYLSNKKIDTSIINKQINLELAGKRLIGLRNKEKLSQRALASELKTSPSTIASYESGKTLLLTAFAIQLCKKYNVSLDWLYGRTK